MSFLHSLEPRRLFAANPVFTLTSKGTLLIQGSAANDQIIVQFKHDDPSKGVQAVVTLDKDGSNSTFQSFGAPHGKVKRVRIDAGAGDDFINAAGSAQWTLPVSVLGGDGNDIISFSRNGPAFIDGGDGNDQIGDAITVNASSKKNSDVLDDHFSQANTTPIATLLGGNGDDILNGDTNDHVDGGAGNDTSFLLVVGNNISTDRAEALSHDYTARLGALSIETNKGDALAVSKAAIPGLDGQTFNAYYLVG